MNAEIIAVGSELLLGQITNTNARFLSLELAKIGVNVYYHTVVGDNRKRLIHAIKTAQDRADLIIFSGGLGPTKDDLTKETIGEALGIPLEIHEEALRSIKQFYKDRKIPMSENNKKQANVLKGSVVFPNETGMAPGMAVQKDGKTYILLPGPPSEIKPMFLNYGIPYLTKLLDQVSSIESRVLRFFNIGESALESKLEDLFAKQTNPTMAPLAGDGEVTVRLTAKHESRKVRKKMLDAAEKEILDRVGEFFYGYNDTTIIKELAKYLKENHLTLAAAESLTGGYFQKEVTSISGVSQWFKGGVVSYTNDVKMNVLHVKQETLETDGAVSARCAEEMAENVRKLMDSDIGISFTGVAGPDPSEGKKVGTVFVGIAIRGKQTQSYQLQLSGDRHTIRMRSVVNGAWKALQALNQNDNN